MAGSKVRGVRRREKGTEEQEKVVEERERENWALGVLGTEEEGEEAKFGQYFFRVFFPELYGERLRIPPAFLHNLQNETTGVISLKSQSGNTWIVELSTDYEELFFGNGWKEFVADHSLETGHLLMFRYDGHSKFSVRVFDGRCIEKPSALHAKPCKDMVIKQEKDDGDMYMNATDPPEIQAALLEEANESTRKRIREMDSNDTILKKCSNVLEKGKKKVHGASVGSLRVALTTLDMEINVNRTKRVGASRGRNFTEGIQNPEAQDSYKVATRITLSNPDSDSPNRVHEESIPCNKSTKSTPLLLRMNKDVRKFGLNIMVSERQPAVISQRPLVTEEQKINALEKAKRFKSEKPFVLHIMKETNVYVGFFMKLPCKFVRKCLPQTDTDMKLWDPQGESWEVNYIYHNELSVGAFSGGWSSFSLANHLEKFDVCVFELLSKDNIKAHIFRVDLEIIPFLPDPNMN